MYRVPPKREGFMDLLLLIIISLLNVNDHLKELLDEQISFPT